MYKFLCLIFCFNLTWACAEPTLMLRQITKLNGSRIVYINSQGLQIINQKQNVEIITKLPQLQIYYVNKYRKLYYVTNLNSLPKPRGTQIISIYFDNGNLVNRKEFWTKYKYDSKLNYSIYRFKSNPNNIRQRSAIGELKLGNFKKINQNLLMVLNKISYFPDLDNIVLEINGFNSSTNVEKLIETKSIKYIDYDIHDPDLKSLKRAQTLNNIFEYDSESNTINNFANFAN